VRPWPFHNDDLAECIAPQRTPFQNSAVKRPKTGGDRGAQFPERRVYPVNRILNEDHRDGQKVEDLNVNLSEMRPQSVEVTAGEDIFDLEPGRAPDHQVPAPSETRDRVMAKGVEDHGGTILFDDAGKFRDCMVEIDK